MHYLTIPVVVAVVVLLLAALAFWLVRRAKARACAKCGGPSPYVPTVDGVVCGRCFYEFRGQYPCEGE